MNLQASKYLLLILFVLSSLGIYAQSELKNKVMSLTTLLPLENASIYVQNTTIGTISNADGKFVLQVPKKFENDTLIVSSIGFKSFKTTVNEFDSSFEIYLEEDIASLDEIVLVAEPRPTTGNEIVLKAIEKLPNNLPEAPYLQKGFLRHKERNKVQFKWLIESAITLYDSSYASGSSNNLKINVDQVRKSYDLRNVDSLFTYVSYLNAKSKYVNLKSKNLLRDTIKTSSLVKAIKWNDTRVNGLENLFKGKLNLVRNSNENKALFNEDILKKHQFELDTVLVDNERKIYKIKIAESLDFVGLDAEGIYEEGYIANGWIYVYWDTYAIKRVEYELIAGSKAQKTRSKTLFGTNVNHKLILSYMEYQDKMYLNYMYYETPKLVNVGYKPNEKFSEEEEARYHREERYYNTVQEILFSEVILDEAQIDEALNAAWDPDIFASKPYQKEFWRTYNVLLESEEDEKLIEDLTRRSSLYKD